MSRLLNRTVTNGIQLKTVVRPERNEVILGYELSTDKETPNLTGRPIPVTISGKRPTVHLTIIQTYVLDNDEYLTAKSSTLGVYTSEEARDGDLVLSVDYVREPDNEYPGSHLHVAGQRDDLDQIYLGDDRKKRLLRDLHLPVGGKRFRPALEDVIEFMILEQMCEPRENWKTHIDSSRDNWFRMQAKATARAFPNEAAESLKELGWDIKAPDQ